MEKLTKFMERFSQGHLPQLDI